MTAAVEAQARPARSLPGTILVVDDHALFREGLRRLLESSGQPARVLEAASARQALAMLAEQDDLDLVLLDLALPDARPFEVLQASRRLQAQAPVVVISATEERFEIERALGLGAQAYVFKSTPSAGILAAIRRVMNGHIVAPRLPDGGRPLGDGPAGAGELTERQIQVVRMLSRGLANKEIAELLGVAENTVKVHLAHIYRTLGVQSRATALLKARRIGLVDGE